MSVIQANDSNFQQEVQDNEKIVVKYFADWCGSCRLIAPKYKRLSEDERFKDIKFLEVNAEENPEARKWAGVTNLPFFAVVKDGQIVEADSLAKEEKLVEMLNKLAV